jgi:hypothetical protein
MRQEWEAAHTVTEELVQGPPSRRANATLTPCPNGNHLWSIGGEYFSEDGKAVRIVSPSCDSLDPPSLSTFTMTSFATLQTRCVSAIQAVTPANPLTGRMAKIRFPNLPWSPFCTQRRRLSRRRRQTLSLWCGPCDANHVVDGHAVVGGEFSSLYQNSFHHYRDLWVFDIPTHTWDRIETKVRPSARSGHR